MAYSPFLIIHVYTYIYIYIHTYTGLTVKSTENNLDLIKLEHWAPALFYTFNESHDMDDATRTKFTQ